MSVNGRIVLITGASRGIGKAIASELAQRGAIVIGTATTESGAHAITDYLSAMGANGRGAVLELPSADSIEPLIKTIQDEFGPISVLVNNAGITRDNILLRMKDTEWADVMEVNLTAIYRLCKACLRPMMKARYGRIINISSIVGASGNPGQSNYAAAKAGMIGFSKSLAQEIGSRNITVNIVAPGFINTDMTGTLSDEQRTTLIGQIPLGRLGGAQDIANAVAFLASDDAAYITGETLHVNGGLHMS